MLIKRCMLIFIVQLVSILATTQPHAQLSPGIQKGGPIQLDPKAQQQQDLKRRLDARPPGIPTLTSPSDGDILQIPVNQPARVLFQWQTGPGAPVVSTRGIKVVADTQAAKYHLRKPGKPRTGQNSLQLEVRVNTDAYVTIVDVDSEGGVNLLFPNNYQQRSFYGDGFVKASESVLIPDSIKPGNKAGFYWDYSPPKGTDTVRVFTSTDLQTAQMIRDRIKSLQTSGEQAGTTVKTRSVSSTVQSLRHSLATVAARGIITVADATSYVPGENGTPPQADLAPAPSSDMTPPAGIQEQPALAAAAMPETGVPAAQVMASSAPAADWTAASVTIMISD